VADEERYIDPEAGPSELLGELAGAVAMTTSCLPHWLSRFFLGAPVHCVDLETLIRAKRAAGRPKDLEVIAELESLRADIL
jgi:hypothetical protein